MNTTTINQRINFNANFQKLETFFKLAETHGIMSKVEMYYLYCSQFKNL